MGNANIRKLYGYRSSEDKRTFDRWITANAVFGLIFATLFVAMALAGSMAVKPPENAMASARQPTSPAQAIPVVGFE
jgi:hypothetical protein